MIYYGDGFGSRGKGSVEGARLILLALYLYYKHISNKLYSNNRSYHIKHHEKQVSYHNFNIH